MSRWHSFGFGGIETSSAALNFQISFCCPRNFVFAFCFQFERFRYNGFKWWVSTKNWFSVNVMLNNLFDDNKISLLKYIIYLCCSNLTVLWSRVFILSKLTSYRENILQRYKTSFERLPTSTFQYVSTSFSFCTLTQIMYETSFIKKYNSYCKHVSSKVAKTKCCPNLDFDTYWIFYFSQ